MKNIDGAGPQVLSMPGVRALTVERCTFDGTESGIRIKSRPSRHFAKISQILVRRSRRTFRTSTVISFCRDYLD
jgi:polygalacturonase